MPILDATPANYVALASTLAPGDTLRLARGSYDRGLLLVDKAGTAARPIVVVGPADHTARLSAPTCCAVVRLDGSSFLQLKNLAIEVNGTGVDSAGSSHDV